MAKASPFDWLSEAISQATRSAKFCAAGRLPDIDPGLDVDGLGAVALPLKRGMAKSLVAACRVAPYGKGTETLVNKKVRNTFELEPQKFRLSPEWDEVIADATRSVAGELGLPADQLEAKLYKLLVYERGGFFLPHRDSEKLDRMVASLIVVLPNRFEGGELIVRHGAVTQEIEFRTAAAGEAPCFAAFYADCEHEVQRVTGGVRICLAYNLVLRGKRGKTSAKAAPDAPADALAMSIGNWIATQPGKPLVFALEHHYTPRGLSLELLKGADRPLANEVVAAAEKGDCLVHLAQVSRHLLQFADDGSFDDDWSYSHRSRAPRRQAISVGETYEDELIGTDWTTLEGKKQPWCDIPFELSAIVASEPIDKWKPTSEEFEGYTGNAGNTLDRWYHRSAIVVWHRDQHFDVIVRSGPANSIPMFCSMATKLPKTPKKRLDEARNDCVRFARAIAVQWPKRIGGFAPGRHLDDGLTEHFADHLPLLHDRDTISLFLSQMAAADQTVRLTSLLLAAGDEFGPCAFADEMRSLMSSPWTMRGRPEVPPRDIEWLSDFCCIWPNDAAKLALARDLCGLAVDRFCEPLPPPPKYFVGDFRRESSDSTTSLPLLLKGLAVVGLNDELSRVLRFVQTSPHEFDLDRCQVPVLKSLIPWAKKKLGEVPVLLAYWLDSVRYQLESVTAREPTPPTDWARPADVDCDCRFCGQLKAFLADPASEVGRIPAAEDKRQHLISMIARHRCDVTNTLERKGSPYSLVLTKTSGSFDRAVKRFATDQKLLEQLPVLK